MTDQEFIAWLQSPTGGECWIAKRKDAATFVAIKPLLFHWTMILCPEFDTTSITERFCYANQGLAMHCLLEWEKRKFEGEPIGWHRHPTTGRRRPDGDPKREYVQW